MARDDDSQVRPGRIDDRHQFRVILSPEDGAAYEDLKPFSRDLMAQMEADLGTTERRRKLSPKPTSGGWRRSGAPRAASSVRRPHHFRHCPRRLDRLDDRTRTGRSVASTGGRRTKA